MSTIIQYYLYNFKKLVLMFDESEGEMKNWAAKERKQVGKEENLKKNTLRDFSYSFFFSFCKPA